MNTDFRNDNYFTFDTSSSHHRENNFHKAPTVITFTHVAKYHIHVNISARAIIAHIENTPLLVLSITLVIQCCLSIHVT